jgi:hypothetical protein
VHPPFDRAETHPAVRSVDLLLDHDLATGELGERHRLEIVVPVLQP